MSSKAFTHDPVSPADLQGVEQMRGSVRFPLRLPVRVKTDSNEWEAMTEDISSTGVQFSSRDSIAPDTVIHWDICLPAAVMGSPGDVKVSCTGRVMWAREVSPEYRFGVVIDSYVLRGNQE